MTPAGLLIVDKPAGWTSHDVVARTRRLAGTRRVGHAGTLDPMATGVLVLGIEQGTKLLTYLVGCEKEYSATIRLGQSTVTDDAEGEFTAALGADQVSSAQVERAVAGLTGAIMQVPSAVSAIKIKGVRSYARVRGGEAVELPPRPVTVSRFEVHDSRRQHHGSTPVLDLGVSVEVSSGTYVRALARDLGSVLGCGGHLIALRRTRVGSFGLDQAAALPELSALHESQQPLPVIPLAQAAAAQLPVRQLSAQEALDLRQGRRLAPGTQRADAVAALDPDGAVVAVLDDSGAQARSRVVFAPGTA